MQLRSRSRFDHRSSWWDPSLPSCSFLVRHGAGGRQLDRKPDRGHDDVSCAQEATSEDNTHKTYERSACGQATVGPVLSPSPTAPSSKRAGQGGGRSTIVCAPCEVPGQRSRPLQHPKTQLSGPSRSTSHTTRDQLPRSGQCLDPTVERTLVQPARQRPLARRYGRNTCPGQSQLEPSRPHSAHGTTPRFPPAG